MVNRRTNVRLIVRLCVCLIISKGNCPLELLFLDRRLCFYNQKKPMNCTLATEVYNLYWFFSGKALVRETKASCYLEKFVLAKFSGCCFQ